MCVYVGIGASSAADPTRRPPGIGRLSWLSSSYPMFRPRPRRRRLRCADFGHTPTVPRRTWGFTEAACFPGSSLPEISAVRLFPGDLRRAGTGSVSPSSRHFHPPLSYLPTCLPGGGGSLYLPLFWPPSRAANYALFLSLPVIQPFPHLSLCQAISAAAFATAVQ